MRHRTRATAAGAVLVWVLANAPAAIAKLPVVYNGVLGYSPTPAATASPPRSQ